jgi:hypothetical protein
MTVSKNLEDTSGRARRATSQPPMRKRLSYLMKRTLMPDPTLSQCHIP